MNLMNFIGTISLRPDLLTGGKKKPMFRSNKFTYERLFDASDAKLFAEQEIWACVEPAGRNDALNSSTGDAFKWKTLWMLMVEVPKFRDAGNSLVELMQRKRLPRWRL